jgi:hypothetical protein
MAMTICAACSREIEVDPPISRREECPHCRADLRSCRQCAFIDERAPRGCREPHAEIPRDRERANSCELYRIRSAVVKEGPTREEARAAAEALFKKKP